MRETMVTISGNLTEDPRLQLTGEGVRVARFTVATNERRYDRKVGGWRDARPMFWSVSCWRNMGENAADSLKKGDPVVVHGRLYASEYVTEEGVRRTSYKIDAHAIGHNLNFGVSRYVLASAARDDDEEYVAVETGELRRPGDAVAGPDFAAEPEGETDAA